MRREYEHQEQARLLHLRQLEEDMWVAEQLEHTPDLSQVTTSPSVVSSAQTMDEQSTDDGYYPDEDHRRIGKFYEEINDRKLWDFRASVAPLSRSLLRRAPPCLRDLSSGKALSQNTSNC